MLGEILMLERVRSIGASIAAFLSLMTAISAEPLFAVENVQPQPRADAADLAGLAPPSNRSTADVLYGDAALPPARASSHIRVHYFGTDRCHPLRSRCYQQFYRFTPSYVSAPQVFEQNPRLPSPLRPPVTGAILNAYSAVDRERP